MTITYHPNRFLNELIASDAFSMGPDGGLGGGGGVGIGSGVDVAGGRGTGGLGRGVGGSGVAGSGVGPMTRRHMLATTFSEYIASRLIRRCSSSNARWTLSSISTRVARLRIIAVSVSWPLSIVRPPVIIGSQFVQVYLCVRY